MRWRTAVPPLHTSSPPDCPTASAAAQQQRQLAAAAIAGGLDAATKLSAVAVTTGRVEIARSRTRSASAPS